MIIFVPLQHEIYVKEAIQRHFCKMANRTVKDAQSVKGTNPQYLVEKIIRSRIYECRYWKEECFALSGV